MTRPICLLLLLAATLAAAPAHAQMAQVRVVAPADVREDTFSFKSGSIVLPGTLTLPAVVTDTTTFAIIVAGSGPTDRNGNGPLVQTNTYAQLAWELARRGVASLRYDKRGIGPASKTLDHSKMVIDDFVGDVANAAAALRAHTRFGRLVLIGHSEGAQLVLQAANRGAGADAVVMMSGMGRRLPEVLHDQFALQMDAASLAVVDTAFARFLRGEAYGEVPAAAKVVFVPFYRELLKSMAEYDPAAEIGRATVPVLIVQGETDWQVTAADASRLRAANARAGYLFLPQTNHVLKHAASRVPQEQAPLYSNPDAPLVEMLVPGIVEWVTKALGGV